MGEGAGCLILEAREVAERRGARILGRIAGFGMSADAYHITSPVPGGAGAQSAMRAALQDAGIRPEDVDYINAHGTSTPHNDRTETQAIRAVLGPHADRVVVGSTKSMTGHLLGAAGGGRGHHLRAGMSGRDDSAYDQPEHARSRVRP